MFSRVKGPVSTSRLLAWRQKDNRTTGLQYGASFVQNREHVLDFDGLVGFPVVGSAEHGLFGHALTVRVA